MTLTFGSVLLAPGQRTPSLNTFGIPERTNRQGDISFHFLIKLSSVHESMGLADFKISERGICHVLSVADTLDMT